MEEKEKVLLELLEGWQLQPQEREGTYRFDGKFLVTKNVKEGLKKEIIARMYLLILQKVEEEDGLDYLQVFIHQETEEKLFFMDQINDEMKEEHPPEHNYCTLMYSSEY